jgi:hypothetical protein
MSTQAEVFDVFGGSHTDAALTAVMTRLNFNESEIGE